MAVAYMAHGIDSNKKARLHPGLTRGGKSEVRVVVDFVDDVVLLMLLLSKEFEGKRVITWGGVEPVTVCI